MARISNPDGQGVQEWGRAARRPFWASSLNTVLSTHVPSPYIREPATLSNLGKQMKLKQSHSGSPRPFQTWYFVANNTGIVPDKVGHASSRIGAVRAGVNRLRTSEEPWKVGSTPEFYRVEIYDEDMTRCNTVERRKEIVAIKGYY